MNINQCSNNRDKLGISTNFKDTREVANGRFVQGCSVNVTSGGSRSNLFHETNQQRTFTERTLINQNRNYEKDINPKYLTSLLNKCKTFEALKNLYEAQKNKPYFDFMHARIYFLNLVNLYIKFRDQKIQEELIISKDKLFSYTKCFNDLDCSDVISNLWKILDFIVLAKPKKKHEKALAIHMVDGIDRVFKIITTQIKQENFHINTPSVIARTAVKVINYEQTKNLGLHIPFAMEALEHIFQAIIACDNLEDFTSEALISLHSSIIKAGFRDDVTGKLLTEICNTLCNRNLDTLNLQFLCNLAWSFSLTGQFSLIYDQLKVSLSKCDGFDSLSHEHAHELYTALLLRALENKTWNPSYPDTFLNMYLSEGSAKKVRDSADKKLLGEKENTRSSRFQHEVRTELQKIVPPGFRIEEEYCIKPYPIDFAILNGEKLIALIEVNGPTHFMIDGDYDLSHHFKQKVLKLMGHKDIFNINYAQWAGSNDRARLLKGVLSVIDWPREIHNREVFLSPAHPQQLGSFYPNMPLNPNMFSNQYNLNPKVPSTIPKREAEAPRSQFRQPLQFFQPMNIVQPILMSQKGVQYQKPQVCAQRSVKPKSSEVSYTNPQQSSFDDFVKLEPDNLKENQNELHLSQPTEPVKIK